MSDFRDTRISERKFYDIPEQALTADGDERGLITVASTYCYKVGQIVSLKSDTLQIRNYKIKRVESETTLRVGKDKRPITEYSDVSDFLVTDSASITVAQQERPSIDPTNIQGMVFEEEPTVALRNHQVDWLGRSYDASNPFPVQLSDGSIDIGTVNGELEVQLSRIDNYPDAGDVHDSVRIGDQDHEATYTTNDDESKAGLDITMLNRLIDIPHDDVEVTQYTSDGDPEVIEIRDNGQLKRTLTLSYNADGEFQRVQRT